MSKILIAGVVIILVLVGVYLYWPVKEQAQVESAPVASGENANQSASYAGKWRSDEDAKYELEFSADGSFVEYYDGKETEKGAWLEMPSLGDEASNYGDLGLSGLFLKLERGDGPYLYKVLKADSASLQLIYLGRGNILSFTRE